MVTARGKNDILRVKGDGTDVFVNLGATPSVSDNGFFVSIAGTYGTITRFNATNLTGSGVIVIGGGDSNKVYLSEQDDTYLGTAGADRAFGYGGADTLVGRAGNDYMDGGAGNDFLSGGAGVDRLFGGIGDDELYGGTENDKLYGEDGDDLLSGGAGKDRLYGGAGDDLINGGADLDVAYYSGNEADYSVDLVDGNYRVIDLRAGSPDGTDYLGTVERLHFADQNMGLAPLVSDLSAVIDGDTLIVSGPAAYANPEYLVSILPQGSSLNNYQPQVYDNGRIQIEVVVQGTVNPGDLTTVDATGVTVSGVSVGGVSLAYLSAQDDFFAGDGAFGGFANTAYGYDGDDTMWGGESNDELFGGAGDDYLDGDNPYTDLFAQGPNDDILHGGTGNDILFGNVGDDQLFGEEDDDILEGWVGNDYLNGGDGQDVAVFFGNRADYTILVDNGLIIVDAGPDSIFGVDTLENIETLRFDDGDYDAASFLQAVRLPGVEHFGAPIDMEPVDQPLMHIA